MMYAYDEIYAASENKFMENIMTSEHVGYLLLNIFA